MIIAMAVISAAAVLAAVIFLKNRFIWIYLSLFLGLALMFSANAAYMNIMSNFSVRNGEIAYPITKFLVLLQRLSVSDTKYLSLLGEGYVLLSIAGVSGSMLKRKSAFYIMTAALLFVYIYTGLPDVLFKTYLDVNSGIPAVVESAERRFWIYGCLKAAVAAVMFALPYIISVVSYKRTILLIKKRMLLMLDLSVAAAEIVILILVQFNAIGGFAENSYEVFYKQNIPESYNMDFYMFVIPLATAAVLFFTVMKSRVSKKYFLPTKINRIYDTSSLDKNLRMVLHTYKNMFFAIRQLSNEDMYDTEMTDRDRAYITSINKISENALFGITSLMKMLVKLELDFRPIELTEPITLAVDKFAEADKQKISVSYNTDDITLNTDTFYLSEMFYNMLKNALDAVGNTAEPHISIDIYKEDEWFLIKISDNGCGIERNKIKEIFKPLVSYKLGSDNWGIGLYYSNKIVSALNGYLFVYSEPGEYTSFHIYLPKNMRNRGAGNGKD